MRNRLSLLFSWRYLFSKKSHSVINIISGVSVVAIGIPVAAMVILLSVFNGFEQVVRGMYKAFDPDIAVTAVEGKNFDVSKINSTGLRGVVGVEQISFVLDDNALLEYRDRQSISTIRGVDSLYESVIPLRGMVVSGEYEPMFGDARQALAGQGVAYNLGINTRFFDRISVYAPRRSVESSLLPMDSYRQLKIYPSGVFALDAQTDGQFVITPLSFAQEVFDYPNRASLVAVKITQGYDPDVVSESVKRFVGRDFKVLTRYQQKQSLYQIMKLEKWGVFFIIALVMIIASFSIVGSLVMLVIDKRKDIRTIFTFGGTVGFVRGIFLREGMLIAMFGSVGGLIVGVGVCLAQQWFGIVKIPARTFLIDSYPVILKATDVVVVVALFVAVNYLIAKFTVVKMIPKSNIRV